MQKQALALSCRHTPKHLRIYSHTQLTEEKKNSNKTTKQTNGTRKQERINNEVEKTYNKTRVKDETENGCTKRNVLFPNV